MATEKLNLSELKKMIISEAEKIMSLGDPLSVDMNKMTNPGNSTGDALVMTKGTGGFVKKSAAPDAAKNIEDTEEPLEVDMNEMDGDQGHDEQIAAAVKVDAAGSKKSGASVEGMHNANFESKDKNPSTSSSAPFEEREDKVEMNSQDKADAGGAKTYVEPGAELHKGASTGQHAAKFSEKAQNERETAERIAQGIQLPESFKNKADLLNFINEEAKKLSNVLFKESEKKNQLSEGVKTDLLFKDGKPTSLVVVPNRSMRDQAELDAYKMVPVKIDVEGKMAHFNGVGKENSGKDFMYSIDSSGEVADIITYDDKKGEMHWLKEGVLKEFESDWRERSPLPNDELLAGWILEVHKKIEGLLGAERYNNTDASPFKDVENTYDLSKEEIVDYLKENRPKPKSPDREHSWEDVDWDSFHSFDNKR